MQISEMSFPDARPVDGYGPGFFRIAGQVIEGAVLLTPAGSGGWAGLDDPASLVALAGRVDVLIIGTGAEMRPLDSTLRESLEAAGLGVEAMASPAACRTYNVLLGDARRIALAALPV